MSGHSTKERLVRDLTSNYHHTIEPDGGVDLKMSVMLLCSWLDKDTGFVISYGWESYVSIIMQYVYTRYTIRYKKDCNRRFLSNVSLTLNFNSPVSCFLDDNIEYWHASRRSFIHSFIHSFICLQTDEHGDCRVKELLMKTMWLCEHNIQRKHRGILCLDGRGALVTVV